MRVEVPPLPVPLMDLIEPPRCLVLTEETQILILFELCESHTGCLSVCHQTN